LDAVPQKYQNAGLWKAVNMSSNKNAGIIDPFESGGLNDDDIYSKCPPFFPRQLFLKNILKISSTIQIGETRWVPQVDTFIQILSYSFQTVNLAGQGRGKQWPKCSSGKGEVFILMHMNLHNTE